MPFRLPHLPVALFASAVVASVAPLEAAAPAWHMLETPRFTIVSQLREKPTRMWADEFNQFIAELGRVLHVDQRRLPPLTVVLFDRKRDFAPFKPLRSDGRGPAPVDGFFNSVGSWSVIGLAESFTNDDTRGLIFHEGVHWFMSADPNKYPLWLDEGIAEVFSTFRTSRGNLQWGAAIASHVGRLQHYGLMPFSRFLFLTRDDALFSETDRTSIFYGQAWLFVHYLLYGQREGSRDALADYLAALGQALHPDEAFRQTFGRDYEQMEKALVEYLHAGTYVQLKRRIPADAKIVAPLVPAPAPVVEVALARLAIGGHRFDVAREHAQRAIQFAPDDAGGYEVTALLADQAGDDAAALDAARRAVDLGSNDSRTLFLLAYHRTRAAGFGGLPAAQAREVADVYHRALQARPTDEQSYRNLAGLASVLEEIRPDDLTLLAQGARLYPRAGELVLGLAQMTAQRGDRSEAIALLAEARRRGLSFDAQTIAGQVEQRWLYDEHMTRVEALTAEKKFSEALALYDALAPRISDPHLRSGVIQGRRMLAQHHQLAQAEAAWNAGRMDEARRLLEDLLAQPGVSASTQRFVREQLQRIPAPTAAEPAHPSPAGLDS